MKRVGQKIEELNLKSMLDKSFFLRLSVCLTFTLPLTSAPNYQSQNGYGQTYQNPSSKSHDQTGFSQIRSTLSELKNGITNHEHEIRTFDEKLLTHESTLDSMRQEIQNAHQSQKDFFKSHTLTTDNKFTILQGTIAQLEQANKSLITDLKQMKTQYNDTIEIFNRYKEKIAELEATIEAQNQHMVTLETGLESILEIIQAKSPSKTSNSISSTGKTYKVQPGDSLDKIARLHKISVQALKDANQLTKDRILVGQSLQIP